MNDADIIREEYEAALAAATWYERWRIESRGRFVPALDRLVKDREQIGRDAIFYKSEWFKMADKLSATEAALRDAQTERDRWRALAEGWKRVDDVEQHRV